MSLIKRFYKPYIKRELIEELDQYLFIFTDNTDRTSGTNPISDDSWYSHKYGKGLCYPKMTTALIRGLNNARPISTQHYYHEGHKGINGRWTDDDIDDFKKIIDSEIKDIIDEWNTHKYKQIFVPCNGFFNSKISNINKDRCPKIYYYLCKKLKELNDIVNNNEK